MHKALAVGGAHNKVHADSMLLCVLPTTAHAMIFTADIDASMCVMIEHVTVQGSWPSHCCEYNTTCEGKSHHMTVAMTSPASCRRSRGFGFIEYRDPRDADDAMYKMDGSNIGGRDITVSHMHRLCHLRPCTIDLCCLHPVLAQFSFQKVHYYTTAG